MDEIFGILKFKEEVFIEDYDDLNVYVKHSYTLFLEVVYVLWDRMKHFLVELGERKIILYEGQLDIQSRDNNIKV